MARPLRRRIAMSKVAFAFFFVLGLILILITIVVERQLIAAGMVP